MNDEIREAIMQFQTAIDFKEAPMPMNYSIDLENAKILLDYITNLQKTNKNHSKKLIELGDKITNLQQENERLKRILDEMGVNPNQVLDYKSRCEKASEYFKYQLENLDFYEDTKARMLCAMGIILLQNGSEKDDR